MSYRHREMKHQLQLISDTSLSTASTKINCHVVKLWMQLLQILQIYTNGPLVVFHVYLVH